MHGLVPIVVVLLGVAGFSAYRAQSTHFECPSCGARFKVTALTFAFAYHVMGSRMVTCPKCQTVALMPPIAD